MNEHSSAARRESPQPTKLIYTRTAAGSVAERIAEHGDQVGTICERFGVALNGAIWWPDNASGARLDRPTLAAMLGFCRRHPRRDKEPGEILVQDPSRVGRPLDRSGSPDPTAYAAIASAFETVGWRFRFVTGAEPSQGLEAVHEALEEIAESGSRRMRRPSVQPKGGAE